MIFNKEDPVGTVKRFEIGEHKGNKLPVVYTKKSETLHPILREPVSTFSVQIEKGGVLYDVLEFPYQEVFEEIPQKAVITEKDVQLSKLISDIKLKSKSLKDRLRNIERIIKSLRLEFEPDDYFTINKVSQFNSLSEKQQGEAYMELLKERRELTETLKCIGKTILYLRGDKWRI